MRIIVIEFEDDADADEFVEAYFCKSGELVGMYQVPTIFCECDGPSKVGWVQGKKRGWWVCPYCKRPSKSAWREDKYKIFGAYGFNQLEENDDD